MTGEPEPQLIFIHGAGGTPRAWRYQTPAFSGSLAVELPGHPKGKGYSTIADYAELVTRRLEEEQKRVLLVGHSMGGAIAIEIALNHPELLTGVALIGSGARLRVTPLILDELTRDYAHAAEAIAELAYSPKSDARLRRASVQELLDVPAMVTHDDFEACNHFDRMNEIGRIALPTLIVCGQDDRLTPVKYSQYMKERIRNARLIIIPDAGHSVMLEKPEELNAVLRSFASDLRSPQK